MSRAAILIGVGLLAAPTLRAEGTSERWGTGKTCRHRTMKITKRRDRTWIITVDLSAIGAGAKVYRASLRVDASGSPKNPILIYPLKAGSTESKPVADADPVELEPPRYRSFDVTEVVRDRVSDKRQSLGLWVKRFEGWRPDATSLEITYEGAAVDPPPQASGLKVVHRKGQTFITWTEIDKLIDSDRIRYKDFWPIARKGSPRGEVTYRVYRSEGPITAQNIGLAEGVDEVDILSGYDRRIRQKITHGEITQGNDANVIVPRYVVEDQKPEELVKVEDYVHGKNRVYPQWLGKQLPLHTGLYVHNPAKAGRAHYAVVSCVNGVENTRDLSAANSLAAPVEETVGPGEPILYRRIDKSSGAGRNRKERETLFYVYWVGPPRSNLPLVATHMLIGVEQPKSPEARSLRIKMGIADFYGSELLHGTHAHAWRNRPHIVFQAESEVSYTASIGFHSAYRTLRSYSQGVVDPYTVRVLESTLSWARRRCNVDPGRIISGNAILAVHLPHIITYCEAGGYQSVMNYMRSPLGRRLPRTFGPIDISKTAEGGNAWQLLDVERTIRKDPSRETPYLWCPGGKGPGHEMETGWAQNPRSWRALIETKRPFAAAWGGVVRNMFGYPPKRWREMKYDRNVPAFGNCSLDDVPGTGSLFDGDMEGQLNGYLWWDAATGVDEAGKWELVVYLVKEAPRASCTVDVTPRRQEAFKAKPGEKLKWTNFGLAEGKVVQSGAIEADKWGLVTVPAAVVTKGRNRITISR